MPQTTIDYLGLFSGFCSIVALLLFFITIPKHQRTVSLLVTSILIGLPVILFLVKGNNIVFSVSITVYTISVVLFAYNFGKAKAEKKSLLPDLLYASNKRTNGQEWIIEKVFAEKKEVINIDCFGVKVDALYKVIKGTSFKSKLPNDAEVNMRVLILEPDSFGVHSRSKLEKNERIKKDVPLMKDVYINLVKEYKKHQFHTLKVKTFEFTPGFYILRVNDHMLIGTYLAESGYDNLCLHLQKKDGKTFNQYERFFERVWLDYSKNVIPNNTKSQNNS